MVINFSLISKINEFCRIISEILGICEIQNDTILLASTSFSFFAFVFSFNIFNELSTFRTKIFIRKILSKNPGEELFAQKASLQSFRNILHNKITRWPRIFHPMSQICPNEWKSTNLATFRYLTNHFKAPFFCSLHRYIKDYANFPSYPSTCHAGSRRYGFYLKITRLLFSRQRERERNNHY